MKKIDFHMHTVPTRHEKSFVFNMEALLRYVESAKLDCIAITNHNMFDALQFQEIRGLLGIKVLPGIEIDLEGGHLLLIADDDELQDFSSRCRIIQELIKSPLDSISLEDLGKAFPDLSKYILIPHYEKSPEINHETLANLRDYVTAGEVSSPKKFIYCLKDSDSLVPVLFSDLRMCDGISHFPMRQTYLDIGEITVSSIKSAMRDKSKVFLSKEEGHRFFDALDNGLKLSTGLNVIVGERSTGKSYTLDRIFNEFENVKYIRQFSLLERDDEADKRRFEELLSNGQSVFTRDYFKEFSSVVDAVSDIDIESDDRSIERYVSSLLRFAKEAERKDAYSKAYLFSECEFLIDDADSLKALIASVENLIENTQYRSLIDSHISLQVLRALAVDLMKKFAEMSALNQKKVFVNDLVSNIKRDLQLHTASVPVDDVDFYAIAMNKRKIKRFSDVVSILKIEKRILTKEIQGYSIVCNRRKFTGASQLQKLGVNKLKFSDAFAEYGDPYRYLRALHEIQGLNLSECYKYFVQLEYQILNNLGFNVSGGERSEFRLLEAINDAQHYSMLLIDEPESSFDNLFLIGKVNKLIKEISKAMPVVLVTHNSTVGASIMPDYLLYTQRSLNEGKPCYDIFCGHPSDKVLTGLTGATIQNHQAILNCLEAGEVAYIERSGGYAILKN